MTSQAVLYEINLDKFYLKKDESVFVREKHLGEQFTDCLISSFELYHDRITHDSTYIVGSSKNFS